MPLIRTGQGALHRELDKIVRVGRGPGKNPRETAQSRNQLDHFALESVQEQPLLEDETSGPARFIPERGDKRGKSAMRHGQDPVPKRLRRLNGAAVAVSVMALAGPASAQLIGGALPSLPPTTLPGPKLPDGGRLTQRLPRPPELSPAVGAARSLATQTLEGARRLGLETLVRDHPDLLELDDQGTAVVRGEVLAVSPGSDALARLQAAGFTALSRSDLGVLGFEMIVLGVPPGLSARDAMRRVREIDPTGQYDFNHIYSQSGAAHAIASVAAAPAGGGAGDIRIGLVDAGVDTRSPALRTVVIEQHGFAPGGVRPQGHGLATAALLAGAQGQFQGAAPGARLYVADVYGTTAAGGSAAALAQALGWMAQVRVPVINVSLVGPPNLTLQAVIRAMIARGHLIVAAVGNDGPAAPPLYPAAYPGVVAVTAVDRRRKLLPEAGRPGRIDFTAPGADMAVPASGGGFTAVRGTSFAAPIVAGRLARHLPAPDPAGAARAKAAVARDAIDLGARGPDALYGHGLVGADLATRPAAVAARGLLTGR